MADRPVHSRSTLGYVVTSIITALVAQYLWVILKPTSLEPVRQHRPVLDSVTSAAHLPKNEQKQNYTETKESPGENRIRSDDPSSRSASERNIIVWIGTSPPVNHPGSSVKSTFQNAERQPTIGRLKFNRDPKVVSGKINTALVIDSATGPDGFVPSDALYGLLGAPSTNLILNLFDEQHFKSSGAFETLYGGNSQPVRESGALASVDYLILAKVTFSFDEVPELDRDLRSCRLTFAYKTFDGKVNLVKSNTLTTVGAGLSEISALKTALERLAHIHSNAILLGQ